MIQIMVSTVKKSYIFKEVGPEGYSLAAKTGTAQVPMPTGGYGDKFIHNLVAFFPAWSPRFIILLKIDNPQGVETAAFSLSNSLHNLVTYLIHYYEIEPDE